MKLTNRLFMGAALVALPAFAFANPVELTNPSATFSNTGPAADQNVNYVGSTDQEVRWGVPFQQAPPPQQSGLRFDVFGAPFTVDTGNTFDLGTLTHFNHPVNIPTVMTTDLAFSFDTAGVTSRFLFSLGVEETPNSGTCAYGAAGDTPCPDRISFPNMTGTQTFTMDGTEYTLYLLGFGPDANNIMDGFITQENLDNTTHLWAKIDAAPVGVPEPNALLLMALGLFAVGGAVRLSKKQDKKQNKA